MTPPQALLLDLIQIGGFQQSLIGSFGFIVGFFDSGPDPAFLEELHLRQEVVLKRNPVEPAGRVTENAVAEESMK